MCDFLGLLNHLRFSDSQSRICNSDSKVIYLYAVKLVYRNFYRICLRHHCLTFHSCFTLDYSFKCLVFKPSQTQESLCKEIARTAGRVKECQARQLISESFKGDLTFGYMLFSVSDRTFCFFKVFDKPIEFSFQF